MKGEEALATGIHENKLIFRLRIRAIRIKPKDDFPVRIIDEETISREEHRGLMNCKVRFLFETEFLIHYHLLHSSNNLRGQIKILILTSNLERSMRGR